jgi:hypothetical protein
MIGFDPMFWMVVGPGLIFAMIAAAVVQSTFKKYSRVGASSGLTGAEAAERMLRAAGVGGVTIEQTKGFLSDHYDPASNTLRLSPEVYQSDSLSSIGVACHEAGHALQKAHGYAPLGLRSTLVPVANIGSNLSFPILIVGLLLHAPVLVKAGIVLFAAAVVVTLITLPVEWNASARAKGMMVTAGIVTPQESVHAGRVLNAAFLTYVASAVTAILHLLYYVMLANRRS